MTGEKAGDPMFDLAAFSAAVRDCSAALGMSVREAARDSGISPATFNRIQRGKAPDVENYLRIMAWLKLNQWPAPMTAPAAMPSVEIEQTALLILQVLEAASARIYPDEESIQRLEPHVERIKARYGEIRGRSFSEAHQVSRVEFIRDAIAALFAPILAEKEREIRERDAWVTHWQTKCQATRALELAAEARALAAEAALAAERERCLAIVEAQVPEWVKQRSGPYWDGYCEAMEDAAHDIRKGAAAIRAQGE